MGIHLSSVVGAVAAIPALVVFAFRKTLPLPASIIISHVSLTGFLVAIAASQTLAQHTTHLLGKRGNGSIHPINQVLFYPYFVGLRIKLAIQRLISSEPIYNEMKIVPGCYLGGWPSEEALVPNAHPAILDVTCELPLKVKTPAYKVIHVWDTHAPRLHQIDEGVQFIKEQLALNRPVLIHCAHGHGRSATIFGALIIASGAAQNASEAEKLMKKYRPRVRLNSRQHASLSAWMESKRKAH